jgi:hypothetical protein
MVGRRMHMQDVETRVFERSRKHCSGWADIRKRQGNQRRPILGRYQSLSMFHPRLPVVDFIQ